MTFRLADAIGTFIGRVVRYPRFCCLRHFSGFNTLNCWSKFGRIEAVRALQCVMSCSRSFPARGYGGTSRTGRLAKVPAAISPTTPRNHPRLPPIINAIHWSVK
jgi:hypothetical protein